MFFCGVCRRSPSPLATFTSIYKLLIWSLYNTLIRLARNFEHNHLIWMHIDFTTLPPILGTFSMTVGGTTQEPEMV